MRFLRRRRDDMPDAEERERARREQIEILSALAAAVDDWATVVPLVGSCATFDEAVEELSLLLDVDEEGARAILDLQLRRLVERERERIRDDLGELSSEVEPERETEALDGRSDGARHVFEGHFATSLEPMDTPLEVRDFDRATCHVCRARATTFARFGPAPPVRELGDGVFLCDTCLSLVVGRDAAALEGRFGSDDHLTGIATEIVTRSERFWRPQLS